ncbi:MAG: hypothetical protein NXH85_10950 [Pseudomonadaceae bacterium]|nr:hypothetical protein [Pseudomonadaceae bacterium]
MRELKACELIVVSGGCDTTPCPQNEPFVELYPNLVQRRAALPDFAPSPDPWRPIEVSS